MEQIKHSIVVIGGGPAGMAAAVAAFDAGVQDVVILDREEQPGGILKQCIHNGFGLHKLGRELTGPEYAAVYEQQVLSRGIKIYRETTAISLSKERVVLAQSKQGILKIKAGAVVLAMGCRERGRGALNIPGTRPAGVYSAGTAQKLMNCDGFAVGKRVVVLGSGDIGLIMARRLTLEGAKVEAVCELLPYSGGLKRNIVQCLQDYNIPLYLSTTVAEIHGAKRVEGVTVAKVDENRQILSETKRFIPCDTLLLSVGLIPENELTRGAGIALDPVTGGAAVDENRQTGAPGIFACGNVLHVHDLVDYVSEEAARAGRAAAKFVRGGTPKSARVVKLTGRDGVRYTVPQTVRPAAMGESVVVRFRVANPYYSKYLSCYVDGERISHRKKQIMAPGEMESFTLTREALGERAQEVVFCVEEE